MSRCVNCSLSLVHPLPRRQVGEATDVIVRILRSWITPATMSVEDVLCQECYKLLEGASLNLSSGSTAVRAYGHKHVCFVCGSSILRAKTHKVSIDSPEGNVIMACIPTQQGVAESFADAGDSGPVEEQRVGDTDMCDDVDEDDDDSDSLVESNVCRVCLALDVKMYDLKDIELREMFQNITGIVVTENNHSILERLCWECAGRLKAAAAFRNKALLSDALLQGLANTGEQIRKNDVTCIKENQDYLKSAGTLSIVEVFHTVEIDAEYESVPSKSENNDSDIVQNTVRKMDVEDESMIEAPIKTEIEYDPICPNIDEENRNIVLETIPLFSNNIPIREDTINSAYSSPPPGCSHVEPKYPILGYILKTPSDYENKIKKTVVKITNRDSVSKIVSKKSKEVINHDHTLKGDAKLKNVNVKVGGISKKTTSKTGEENSS